MLIFLLRSNSPHMLAPPHDHDQIPSSMSIVDSNEERQDTAKWCIFIRSKFWGGHSPERQATTLNWFHNVTLPSIIAIIDPRHQ